MKPKQERLTKDQIRELVERLGDIRKVLVAADPVRKRVVYHQLQLQATYYPGKRQVRIEANLDPHRWGYGKCPRTELIYNPTLKFATDLQLE